MASKDYFCKECSNNNNGWCNVKKCQGLKSIVECEYKNKEVIETDIIKEIEQINVKVTKDEARTSLQDHIKLMTSRVLIETKYEYKKWCNEIPVLKFKEDWLVKIIPPFGGAISRFIVFNQSQTKSVSVYLDCYDELGIVGEPYWEAYEENEPERFLMKDTDELLEYIDKVLK